MQSAIVYLTLGAMLMRIVEGRMAKLYVLCMSAFLSLLVGCSRHLSWRALSHRRHRRVDYRICLGDPVLADGTMVRGQDRSERGATAAPEDRQPAMGSAPPASGVIGITVKSGWACMVLDCGIGSIAQTIGQPQDRAERSIATRGTPAVPRRLRHRTRSWASTLDAGLGCRAIWQPSRWTRRSTATDRKDFGSTVSRSSSAA